VLQSGVECVWLGRQPLQPDVCCSRRRVFQFGCGWGLCTMLCWEACQQGTCSRRQAVRCCVWSLGKCWQCALYVRPADLPG
jgi:hypothetical protein